MLYNLGSTHIKLQHRPLYNNMGEPAKSPLITILPIPPLF